MAKDYDIVGSFNDQRARNIDSERTVNLFEYVDPKGKKPKTLLMTSGIVDTDTNFEGISDGVRAQFFFNDMMYLVVGNGVYSLDLLMSLAFLGNINTSTGYVGIDANTHQVTFVDGVDGWVWDVDGSEFLQITDDSFPDQPLDICTLDGYTVVIDGSTPNFQLSSLNQSLIWGDGSQTFTADAATDLLTLSSSADFQTSVPVTVSTTGTLPAPLIAATTYYAIRVSATQIRLATTEANAFNNVFINLTTNGAPVNTIENTGQLQLGAISTHPGNVVACQTLHRRLFLFSEFFTEVWEDAGVGANLPFRRNNSLLMEVGTTGRGTVAAGFDVMIFLAQDRDGLGHVVQVSGVEPSPISTRALDYIFQNYAADENIGVSDARGFLIKENGLIFYRLNFTNANHTWVYNLSMSTQDDRRWHEEELLNGDRHPAQTHAYFGGKNYVGHYNQPTLYIISPDLLTNDGEVIKRMRIGRPFVPEGYNRTRIDRFHLDLVQAELEGILIAVQEEALLTESADEILTESALEILTEDEFIFGVGSQPFVYLSYSKDGGYTFTNRVKGLMGNVGQRSYRTVWRKLGVIPRGQAFVPKLEFYFTSPFNVLGAAWDYEILPE